MNYHKAVIYVAESFPQMVDGLRNHGDPSIRAGGEAMRRIASLPDQRTAEKQQAADDAIYHLSAEKLEIIGGLYGVCRGEGEPEAT